MPGGGVRGRTGRPPCAVRPEPRGGPPGRGRGKCRPPLSGPGGGAVDEVPVVTVQLRGVGVGPPLAAVAGLHVQRVLERATGVDPGRRRVEIVLRPRLVEGGDADAVRRQDPRAGEHRQVDIVEAERVDLDLVPAHGAGQLVGHLDLAAGQVERGEAVIPGPVGHVRSVAVQDARQLVGGCRGHHRGVLDHAGFGKIAGVVGPQGDGAAADGRRRTAGHGRDGGEGG